MIKAAGRSFRDGAVVMAMCVPLLCPAQATPSLPAPQHQGEYLFKLVKFVRWPSAPPDGHRDICIYGYRSAMNSTQPQPTEETAEGLPVMTRKVEKPADEAGCDLLVLDATEKGGDAMLSAAAGKPMLTVSSAPDFLERGGMLQFDLSEGRMRFSVNLTPVGRSKLFLSSELLKVATRVVGSTAGDGGTE